MYILPITGSVLPMSVIELHVKLQPYNATVLLLVAYMMPWTASCSATHACVSGTDARAAGRETGSGGLRTQRARAERTAALPSPGRTCTLQRRLLGCVLPACGRGAPGPSAVRSSVAITENVPCQATSVSEVPDMSAPYRARVHLPMYKNHDDAVKRRARLRTTGSVSRV